MRSPVRAIFLDWGGTLARVATQDATRGACVHGLVSGLRAAGAVVSDAAVIDLQCRFRAACERHEALTELEELDTPAMLVAWADAHGLADIGAHADRHADRFWQPWIGCLDVLNGAVGAIAELKAAGFRLGLVSNCAARPSAGIAEIVRQGLSAHLDFTLFSSEVGKRKPHDHVYAQAVAALHRVNGTVAADEILFVGDTPLADVVGPARQGMQTALVRTGNWRGDLRDLTVQPDWTLDSVCDLPGALRAAADSAVSPAPTRGY